jgi:hypothetical protein
MPFQSIISSPFFKAVLADGGAISETKIADCFNYRTVTEKKKCMQRWAIKSVRKREHRGGRGTRQRRKKTEKVKYKEEKSNETESRIEGGENRKDKIERERKRTGGNRGREKD